MGKKKKKNKTSDPQLLLASRMFSHRMNKRDRWIFERRPRNISCLQNHASRYSNVDKISYHKIYRHLTYNAKTIEHQILLLRELTVERNDSNLGQRREFTRCLLDCLYDHHNTVYQGLLFGSSVNGLGFADSDVDLRLRPLMRISKSEFEPITYDQDMTERVLRNIAFQTNRCSPAIGEFVPSSRCPIAKLTFVNGDRGDPRTLEEGWKFDISLTSTGSALGSLNSYYMRFLCRLEPKFHLLAMTLRYWAKVHDLILSGRLSSYALINMLIFFCQNVEPPLLPTVNEMRERYFSCKDSRMSKETEKMGTSHRSNGSSSYMERAITSLEWQCLITLDENAYSKSKNRDPLCLLLLKFFEFYLKFPYSKNIITIRTGRPIAFEDFPNSLQFHKQFPLKDYLNIQDPFDLKHNLTAGMTGRHFMIFMLTMRCSYERLAHEIDKHFKKPSSKLGHMVSVKNDLRNEVINRNKRPAVDWGLNSLFEPLTNEEKAGFF